MPPPPATLSITTWRPRASPRNCPTMRPSTSTGPPAANGTTMVSGRLGQASCAWAMVAHAIMPASAATIILGMFALPRLVRVQLPSGFDTQQFRRSTCRHHAQVFVRQLDRFLHLADRITAADRIVGAEHDAVGADAPEQRLERE